MAAELEEALGAGAAPNEVKLGGHEIHRWVDLMDLQCIIHAPGDEAPLGVVALHDAGDVLVRVPGLVYI